jgi:hypothetical protein
MTKTFSCAWYGFYIIFQPVVSQWHQAKRYAFEMQLQEIFVLILEFFQQK